MSVSSPRIKHVYTNIDVHLICLLLTSFLSISRTISVGIAEDDLAVRAAMYNVMFQIHVDSGNLRSGLQILDQAIREMPRSPHRL